MQHKLHRSTVWRRRRKEASSLGRLRQWGPTERKLFEGLVKLVVAHGYARQRSAASVSRSNLSSALETKRTSVTEALRAPKDAAYKEMYRTLKDFIRHPDSDFDEPITPGLLLVAAWDEFQPAVETRQKFGQSSPSRHNLKKIETAAIKELVRSGLSSQVAALEVGKANGAKWVYELAKVPHEAACQSEITPSTRTACPSKFFPITARMVHYWRNRSIYRWARDSMRHQSSLIGEGKNNNKMFWEVLREVTLEEAAQEQSKPSRQRATSSA